MNIDKIVSLAQQIIDEARPPAPPVPTVISTPEQLDAAVAAAVAGDTLMLDTTLVYRAPFTLNKPLSLQSTTWHARAAQQMTLDEPAPRFLGGVTAMVDNHQFCGVEMRHQDPTKTIGIMGGSLSSWSRVRVLGDETLCGKRGIDYRGGDGLISDCYVDYIAQPGQDTQAIYSQEMLPSGGLLVSDSYLCAAGQAVMFGGGDPKAAEGIPKRVMITGCILTKRPEWLTLVKDSTGRDTHVMQVKCALELKNVIGFQATSLDIRIPAGISDGQGGYAFVITPRNQNGTRPESTVRDVVIDGFTIIDGGSGVLTILGDDNNHPSGRTTNITLKNGHVADLDYTAYGKDGKGNWNATGRVFTFDRAPANVTLDTIEVHGSIKAAGYFSGKLPPTGLTLANLTVPKSPYGFKIDGSTGKGGQGRAALLNYMPDAVLDGTIV